MKPSPVPVDEGITDVSLRGSCGAQMVLESCTRICHQISPKIRRCAMFHLSPHAMMSTVLRLDEVPLLGKQEHEP